MLRVTGLKKQFEADRGASVAAVDNVSFEVETGKLLTLLGPSGCGKTTTLRSIAGLEEPDGGEIQIGSSVVFSATRRFSLPPNRRRVGMVFQSYAIWPHMTVFQNVAYPLEGSGVPKREVRKRVEHVLALVGLEGFIERPAPFLSGGQQQRVALARALDMTGPRVDSQRNLSAPATLCRCGTSSPWMERPAGEYPGAKSISRITVKPSPTLL